LSLWPTRRTGVTVANMAHWLWIMRATGGNLWNYVAWHRQSSLLLCQILCVSPRRPGQFILARKK
jgi:hypothetical protein